MENSGPLQFEIREDGIYVKIDPKKNKIREVAELVQKEGIKTPNMKAAEEAFTLGKSEFKISENRELTQKNEDIEIRTDVRKMKAEIKFTPPSNKGTLMTKDAVVQKMKALGVTVGIKEDYIEELIKEKNYLEYYLVAEGEETVEPVDGRLEYLFNTAKKTLKPKELPNGSVDYRTVELFEMAVEGQKLVIAHKPVEGKDGQNVFGRLMPAKKGKLPPMFPKGKNVAVSEDGQCLMAACAGHIAYIDGKVNIQPILELNSNVDNSTGNVDFFGSVIVKGDVVSGFTINSGGSVEIAGNIEGATIKAAGDILLAKGVKGTGKAYIQSGGNILANFIEGSTVIAKGSINANYIMHSEVSCGGTLELVGRRAALVGGKYTVGNKITAMIIGSAMSSVTELEVGMDPLMLQEYNEMIDKVEELNKEYAATEKTIEVLSKVNIEDLPEIRKKALVDAIRNKIVLKSKINAFQAKIAEVLPQLSKNRGMIKASEVIYSGVKVMIGSAVLYVHDDISYCTLTNKDGKIHIGSY